MSIKQSLWNLAYWHLPHRYRQVVGAVRSYSKPDFLIIGTQRGGTTSLYNYLTQHPHFKPPLLKEIHYFDLQPQRSLGWYLAHFPLPNPSQPFITAEASPYYLFHPGVPPRVADTLPNVKLVVLLREPIARAYSQFHHATKLGFESRDFETVIHEEMHQIKTNRHHSIADPIAHRERSYLARGLYADQLMRWLEHFPPEQLLICLSESLFENPLQNFNQIADFVGLPQTSIASAKFIPYNRSTYSNAMPVSVRAMLVDFFQPYNQQLIDHFQLDLRLWDGD